MSVSRIGRSAVGWGGAEIGQVVKAVTHHTVLHLPIDCRLTYRVGQRHLEATPDRPVLLPAGSEYTLVYGAGSWAALQVADGTLSGELAARCRTSDAFAKLEPREVPLDPPRRMQLDRLFELVTRLPAPPTEAEVANLESRLASWTAGSLAPAPRSASPDDPRRRQRRVEEWIDAHLDEPITLGRLCAVARVGARMLQKNFLHRRGRTPMAWLAERRLAAARLRLVEASPGDSVTAIALSCGFSHLGRFAVDYRRAYGEAPSATLSHSLERRDHPCSVGALMAPWSSLCENRSVDGRNESG